jgi:hypothetical protein
MADTNSTKPEVGSVAPVEVQNIWKHASVIVTSAITAIPIVLAVLTQFKELPGLPTNIALWIGTAISVLTAVYIAYQKLFGTPVVTPTAAAKLIQTTTKEGN